MRGNFNDLGKNKARVKHMASAVQARMQEDFHDEFEALMHVGPDRICVKLCRIGVLKLLVASN